MRLAALCLALLASAAFVAASVEGGGCPGGFFGGDCSCTSNLPSFIASEKMANVSAACAAGAWNVTGAGVFDLGSSTWNISFDRVNIQTNFSAAPEGSRVYAMANVSSMPYRTGYISVKPPIRSIAVNLSIALHVVDWNKSSIDTPLVFKPADVVVMDIPPNKGRIRYGFHVIPLLDLRCWGFANLSIASVSMVKLGFTIFRLKQCRSADSTWYDDENTDEMAAALANFVALYPLDDLNSELQLVADTRVIDWRVRIAAKRYSLYWRCNENPKSQSEDPLDAIRTFLNEEAHVPMDRMSEGFIIPPSSAARRGRSAYVEGDAYAPPYWSNSWVIEIDLDPKNHGYDAWLYMIMVGLTVGGILIASALVFIVSHNSKKAYIKLQNPTDDGGSELDEDL